MAKSVEQLQNSFEKVVNKLRRNKKVLAAFAFGSIVNGDIWDGSDIDLLVVYLNEFNQIRDLYSESLEVPVHIRFISKDVFIKLCENNSDEEHLNSTLSNSKAVFSKDSQLLLIFNNSRYLSNNDDKRTKLVYLGNTIKDLSLCKKYYQTHSPYTCFEILVRALGSFSELYLNLNKYAVTKDAFKMVVNINEQFKSIVDNLFFKKAGDNAITCAIKYITDYIDSNLLISTELLLDVLSENDKPVSSFELVKNPKLQGLNINFEDILEILSKNKIIIKEKRSFYDSEGILIFRENVYSRLCLK